MTICETDKADLVEREVDQVATQYRESQNLLAMIRAYLGQTADAIEAVCPIPDAFDLDTATGDQLTIIGKWMGFPREHCEGARQAVFGFSEPSYPPPWFGFACDDTDPTVGGFCDSFGPFEPTCDPCSDVVIGGFCSDWAGCNASERVAYVFTDDDLYRRLLKVWRYRIRRDYRRETFIEAVKALFGPFASIFTEHPGTVEVSIGRPLVGDEWQIIDILREVLPSAPGVRVVFRRQSDIGPPFGFGPGWGGFCDAWAVYVSGEMPDTAPCFLGFGDSQPGFC